ncbi:MAG: TadE/TadG family type IV pilus assembly protein [Anaerolineales bacterium]
MKAKKHTSDKEKGQSLLELAVVFTLLMLILAGVADLGRAFFTYIALRDAAQEGAAYGSIYRVNSGDPIDHGAIEARTRSTSSNPVDLQSVDVVVQIGISGAECMGDDIEVTVSYDSFPLVTPFLGSIINSQTIAISASVKDNILTPPCEE